LKNRQSLSDGTEQLFICSMAGHNPRKAKPFGWKSSPLSTGSFTGHLCLWKGKQRVVDDLYFTLKQKGVQLETPERRFHLVAVEKIEQGGRPSAG
jgi:hypothetical protein